MEENIFNKVKQDHSYQAMKYKLIQIDNAL